VELRGGYFMHKLPGIRSGYNAHTTAIPLAASQLDQEAWNAIQATPWRINTWVLDVMLDAWARGLRVGGMEVGEPHSLPERLPDEVWATMAPEDKSARLGRMRELHRLNAGIMGRSQAVLDCLSVADEQRNRPAIWFPHSKDFRHRIYSAATRGANPQGDDIAKGLLMFAEGMPLGPDGLFWLCVRAANCFGMDKLTLEDRVAWTLKHTSELTETAANPLQSTSLWTRADEPWSFLATVHELAMALTSPSPDEFCSHLPVPLDGSCNGLQHLAAMGLDPIGALATNLTPETVRQDIYEEIAKKVRLQVEQDVLDGIDEARVWHGQVTRKVVKRSVMTTPYGVTDRGIRDQLILDGYVPDDDQIGKGTAADYLRDRIVEALSGTVQSARSIMAWLQTTADRLSRAGLPFDWTTPTGSKVREGYYTGTEERVEALAGRVSLRNENRQAGLNTRKQALGSAPNYIHSFDAAHLSLTVNEAKRQGIEAFAMIHDSYGTHACNTTKLGLILRQKFVDIYRTDWLAKLKEEIAGYAPYVKIDDPPPRGDFDITQVNDAPYFFS
jgi:DNA-directed RNA polymerase